MSAIDANKAPNHLGSALGSLRGLLFRRLHRLLVLLFVLADLRARLIDRDVLRLGNRLSGTLPRLLLLLRVGAHKRSNRRDGGVAQRRRVTAAACVTNGALDASKTGHCVGQA